MAKRSVKFAEKRSGEGWKMREEEQEENTDAEDEEGRKRKVVGGVVGQRKGVNGQQPLSCQADDCYADLCEGKKYHRRHKVCEEHAKATIVVVGGIDQRFCQQCSRFHEVSRFDNLKRSCRKRLAGHNERRRKVPSKDDDGSEVTATSPPKYETWRSPNPARHMHIAVRESSFKHFQIRFSPHLRMADLRSTDTRKTIILFRSPGISTVTYELLY